MAVVAAGERWYDGPLRPAAEDLWGAGAFIAALGDDAGQSPEARAARGRVPGHRPAPAGALADCASGRELIGNGYPGDVAVAGERTDSTGRAGAERRLVRGRSVSAGVQVGPAQSRWKTSGIGVMAASARSVSRKNGAISRCHRSFTSVPAIAACAAAKSSVTR